MLNDDERYRLVRGDCLNVLARLAPGSVDAFVTDPPYGIDLSWGYKRLPHAIRNDRRADAARLWRAALPLIVRAARPNSAHVFFGSPKSPWIPVLLARHFTVRGWGVWRKNTWGLGFWMRPQWEQFWLCTLGRPERPARAEPDVWEHKRVHRPRHVAEKPVDLLGRAVRLASRRPGDLVCDPFAGIASTGVAALEEGRRFLGVELDREHHRLGEHRLRAAAAAAAEEPG